MPDVARETRDHPPKRLMGYYDNCQTPLFLATNGKRPVHLIYDFSLRHYAAASQLGLEPATTRSQVRRPTTKPPRHPYHHTVWYDAVVLFVDLWNRKMKRSTKRLISCENGNKCYLQAFDSSTDVVTMSLWCLKCCSALLSLQISPLVETLT